MALGQLIPTERTILYVRALSDLSEAQLAFGFDKALKEFKQEFGKAFPAPAEIREWGFQWRPVVDERRALLDCGDKPPDWEPLAPGELEKMRKEAAARGRKIENEIQVAVPQHEIPKGMEPAEWERCRDQQLRQFREKNLTAGEA